MRSAGHNIVAVARITVVDLIRQRSFVGVILCAIVFLLATRGCWNANIVVNGQRMAGEGLSLSMLRAAFIVVHGLAMLLAGLLSMRVFRRDREEGMMAFVLSKPVGRWQYLIGKIAGLWVVATTFMCVLQVAVFCIYLSRSGMPQAGYPAALAMSALNLFFMVLAVCLVTLLMPEIFAFLVVFGVAACAFVFDALARAANSEMVQSMLAQAPPRQDLQWWEVVYWLWPKAGALEFAAASSIGGGANIAWDLPLASIAVYCLLLGVLILVRFDREEVQ